jgi:hypothetical protein
MYSVADVTPRSVLGGEGESTKCQPRRGPCRRIIQNAGEASPTLAERLAVITIVEIDVMSDREVARTLMDATAEELMTVRPQSRGTRRVGGPARRLTNGTACPPALAV